MNPYRPFKQLWNLPVGFGWSVRGGADWNDLEHNPETNLVKVSRWSYFALGLWVRTQRWFRFRSRWDWRDFGIGIRIGLPRFEWNATEYGFSFTFWHFQFVTGTR